MGCMWGQNCDATLQYIVCVLWFGAQGRCLTPVTASRTEKVLLEGFVSWRRTSALIA